MTLPQTHQRVEISLVLTRGRWEICEEADFEAHDRELIERVGPELKHNSERWACAERGAFWYLPLRHDH